MCFGSSRPQQASRKTHEIPNPTLTPIPNLKHNARPRPLPFAASRPTPCHCRPRLLLCQPLSSLHTPYYLISEAINKVYEDSKAMRRQFLDKEVELRAFLQK
ncbi:hypothetical protein RND81_11G069500 [Saponaria officinalis]|uniref:Uncharacterized protein n=1 Tax=Saponaria officinalis TaxID=3572 RepID=A0AAW1HIU4_SAPOF